MHWGIVMYLRQIPGGATAYHIAVLAIAIMLYITSLVLIYLIPGLCTFWPPSCNSTFLLLILWWPQSDIIFCVFVSSLLFLDCTYSIIQYLMTTALQYSSKWGNVIHPALSFLRFFGYWRSLLVPYKFSSFLNLSKICHWNLDRDCFESIDGFG